MIALFSRTCYTKANDTITKLCGILWDDVWKLPGYPDIDKDQWCCGTNRPVVDIWLKMQK